MEKEEEKVTKVEITNDKRSGLATASLVLGIIGIIGCWIPILNIFSIIMGFVGLGLGIPAFIIYLTKKKGSLGKSIAGLILCLLTIIIGIGIIVSASASLDQINEEFNKSMDELSGNKTEDILRDEIEVTFGKYTVSGNEYLQSGELEVTVKNKTSEGQSYSISVEAIDSKGTRIETDVIYVDNLSANQSVKEKIFTTSYDKLDALKGATFKVYEVSKY